MDEPASKLKLYNPQLYIRFEHRIKLDLAITPSGLPGYPKGVKKETEFKLHSL